MKWYIIFIVIFSCICAKAKSVDIFEELIQQQRIQELKKLKNDPKSDALLEKVTTQLQTEYKALKQKEILLDCWFEIYGNKHPTKLLDPKDPKVTLHRLSLLEQNYAFVTPLAAFIYSLLKPQHLSYFFQDQHMQKISAHTLSNFLVRNVPPITTIKLPYNYECSITPSGVLSGYAEYAINTYLSPSKSSYLERALYATTTVLARLIEHSIKPTHIESVVATDKILVLSNKNITGAANKTIGDAIKALPYSTTSAQKFAQNFAQNLSGEVCYNLTAQLLRPATQKILPEGLVELLFPHDYQPKHFVHESVKYGIALTATCILHILIEDYKKSPILIPGL